VILLDIEGTTTPITFVTGVLFPYARKHLRAHLEEHAGSAEYAALLSRLDDERATAGRAGEIVPATAEDFVEWLMDRDRKSTALKDLQGRIWEDGYRRGELVGDVYPDVGPALERWHKQHVPVGIFSSGSVLAQQLLFRYSSAGDLTGFLRSHFDTRVGSKTDAESYRFIARSVGTPAESCLFLSDVTKELDAAQAAGMRVRLVIRPGNAPVANEDDYEAIRSFDVFGSF
jgi:enolase-phosphatase E1